MSFEYIQVPVMNDTVKLPNGHDFIVRVPFTDREKTGITILIVASSFSLVAVIGLLLKISISAYKTRKSADRYLFVRSPLAAYFISLLFGDIFQAIGSIMNAAWVRRMMVEHGNLCIAQGVFKQAADVSIALWTSIIAVHTFCQLFLRLEIHPNMRWITLILAWSFIATILLLGPAGLNTDVNGSFYGISGYWCWISSEYQTERTTLDYMLIFIAALLSFILYSLVYLRLRGNIIIHGWSVLLRRTAGSGARAWRGQEYGNVKVLAIAQQMLLYPVAYTVVILPLAAARFSGWAGRNVPFEITIFCATIFLFSGLVNVVVFTSTRRILPPWSVLGSVPKSQPKFMPSSTSESFISWDVSEQKPIPPMPNFSNSKSDPEAPPENTIARTEGTGSTGGRIRGLFSAWYDMIKSRK